MFTGIIESIGSIFNIPFDYVHLHIRRLFVDTLSANSICQFFGCLLLGDLEILSGVDAFVFCLIFGTYDWYIFLDAIEQLAEHIRGSGERSPTSSYRHIFLTLAIGSRGQ